MTTRAGFTGLLTGLVATLFLAYPFAVAWPAASTLWRWIAVFAAAALMVGGGALAGRRSGAAQPARCAALGGLAGGLAGVIVFCLLGAAAAGLAAGETTRQRLLVEAIAAMVRQTQATFLAYFLGGIGLGLLGGWLACPRRGSPKDVFDKSAPQMALNVAITAAPAAVVAVVVAAAVFSRLADFAGTQPDSAALVWSILDLPLTVSLLLLLVSHLALTLVTTHEAQQAEHLCGLDEVKMAAYVGIGVAPVLAVLLLLAKPDLFLKPLVWAALLASAGMSLKSLQTLLRQILPRRASFPSPQENRQKVEAQLFGTIAQSNGPRLVLLCVGCGLAMILPLHVVVVSTLVNLNTLLAAPAASVEAARRLFLTQALVSAGLMTGSAALLTGIYLFYLNLGRWFNRRNARRTN
ncbi:MAG: hypothetical protein WA821_07435 [Anaerolineales bacterium]